MTQACLIDLSTCMGCRGCQVACKQWNDLHAEKTAFHVPGGYTNPPTLSHTTFTVVLFSEIEDRSTLRWIFSKRQCMHCLDPACVSACPVSALSTTHQGAVVYDRKKCMGCRYCMLACPFGVPTYEWHKPVPHIRKCTFCADRLDHQIPLCAKTCPTAITYGNRDELIREATRRITTHPARYVDHIYGEREAGGTRWLYLSPVPFGLLGFPTDLGTTAYPTYTETALSTVPPLVVAGSAALAGLYWIIKRRDEADR